jgi:tetratricopeptide (TPR) repeat protein
MRLGISIVKKSFVRLHQADKHSGIVVLDTETGEEEIVPSHFVFDCTGQKRAVMWSINNIIKSSPIQLIEMTTPPVKHHFIAYVEMDDNDHKRFLDAYANVDKLSTVEFSDAILQLRAFDWMEVTFPDCITTAFKKNKVCLYMHAPENLTSHQYDAWVQTVLDCYTPGISYKHLKPSKKYTHKPRFGTFEMHAQALNQISFTHPTLPTIVALGDAQIDFDYTIGHGISNGFHRIDALIDHIEILNHHIAYFDASDYEILLRQQISTHQKNIIATANKLRETFINALAPAQRKLEDGAAQATTPIKQKHLQMIIEEIKARQAYLHAQEMMSAKTLNSRDLQTIHEKLHQALHLPIRFNNEIIEIHTLLKQLAMHWKQTGNKHYNSKQWQHAVYTYQKAIEIYTLSVWDNHDQHEQKQRWHETMVIYSNLILVYKSSKQYSQAIQIGKIALPFFEKCQKHHISLTLQEKITFNLIDSLINEVALMTSQEEAYQREIGITHIITTYQNMLNDENIQKLHNIVRALQTRYPKSSQQTITIHNAQDQDAITEQILPSEPLTKKLRIQYETPYQTTGLSDLSMFSSAKTLLSPTLTITNNHSTSTKSHESQSEVSCCIM